jgi:hypothetical protein
MVDNSYGNGKKSNNGGGLENIKPMLKLTSKIKKNTSNLACSLHAKKKELQDEWDKSQFLAADWRWGVTCDAPCRENKKKTSLKAIAACIAFRAQQVVEARVKPTFQEHEEF